MKKRYFFYLNCIILIISMTIMNCVLHDLIFFDSITNENDSTTIEDNTSDFGYYKIVLKNSYPDYVLECVAEPANGVGVRINQDKGTEFQKWKLIDMGGEIYKIVPKKNVSFCLDESQDPPSIGAAVQLYTDTGNTRKRWILNDIGDGYYEIILVRDSPNFLLTVSQNPPTDGSSVVVNNDLSSDIQQWKLIPLN